MFADSAKLHFLTCCDVGAGSRDVRGQIFGKGCWLSETHVLTALHVWREIRDEYEWPVAIRYDGLYRCEVVFEQADADLLVLEAVAKLEHADIAQPAKYPGISSNQPFLGKTVGYLASLKVPKGGVTDHHTYFASACVSMFMKTGSSKALYLALTGGLIQRGFSGGPVFEENGNVVGILVQSLRFPVDLDNPMLSIATMPIMSALFPHRNEIISLVN
jgi:hypothetical protein